MELLPMTLNMFCRDWIPQSHNVIYISHQLVYAKKKMEHLQGALKKYRATNMLVPDIGFKLLMFDIIMSFEHSIGSKLNWFSSQTIEILHFRSSTVWIWRIIAVTQLLSISCISIINFCIVRSSSFGWKNYVNGD